MGADARRARMAAIQAAVLDETRFRYGRARFLADAMASAGAGTISAHRTWSLAIADGIVRLDGNKWVYELDLLARWVSRRWAPMGLGQVRRHYRTTRPPSP